jgi:hypothetical protein
MTSPDNSGPLDEQIALVSAELDQLVQEAASVDPASGPGAGEIIPAGRTPAQAKRHMASVQARIARTQSALTAKQAELEALFNAKLAEVRNVLAPLKEQVALLTEGIWSINIYLGRDEEVLVLRDGEPAAADEPIVIRQMVLAMDEECMVLADEGGLDHVSIDQFDKWLLADPAHLEQVIPERKGIVALVPRWTDKDYGDPWANQARNAANRQTYLLVKNGDRLARLWTDFNVGRRLVPTADEFTSYFYRDTFDGRRTHLRPGTSEWARAEKAAEARTRHHMRVALLIQGLLDRLTLLQPLPAAKVDVCGTEGYDLGHVRIVTDAENALEAGAESFRDWQRRVNAQLRVGMRVVGAFSGEDWAVDRLEHRYGHARLFPNSAETPAAGVIYTLEDKRADGGLVFRYRRTESVWRPSEQYYGLHPREAKNRASCIIYPRDRFVIAYDLAEVADLERFLRSRSDRRSYATMFPTIKAVIAAKRAEAAEEAPFRLMLAGLLAQENGVDVAEAEAAVPELVTWWKFVNSHHRPLVGTDHPKTIRSIVAEHKRRLVDATKSDDPTVVARLRARYPDAMLVAKKRSGHHVVLLPQPGDRIGAWVTQVLESPSGTVTVEEWKLVGGRPNRWRTLWQSDVFVGWDRGATPSTHLSGPELDALSAQAVERTVAGATEKVWAVLGVTYDLRERRFHVYAVRQFPRCTPERPLTGRGAKGSYPYFSLSWTRRGRTVTLDGPRFSYSGLGEEWTEERFAHRGALLLWTNTKVLDRINQRSAVVAATRQRAEQLGRLSADLLASVRSQWEERWEKAAYADFLDEYGEPDLWEGHRKSLQMTVPEELRFGSELDRAIDHCVEAGLQIGLMSLAQLAALVREQFGVTVDLPDDLAALRLGAQQSAGSLKRDDEDEE